MKSCLALDYTQLAQIAIIIAAAVGTIVGTILGILKFHYMREDRKPKFSYERFEDSTGWKIMILHPDKLIHKFSITIDDKLIPISNSPDKFCERTLRVGEGTNFDVPENVTDDSKVLMKFDNNHKSIKYKDIPLYHS